MRTLRKKTSLILALFIIGIIMPFIPVSVSASPTPVTVGTTDATSATAYGSQRNMFATSSGWYYIFCINQSYLTYKSTTNLNDWSGESTNIRPSDIGYEFSIYYDDIENKVHYIYCDWTATYGTAPIYYRRGTPQDNGTITWDQDEQIAVTAEANYRYCYNSYPIISVDTSGYPYIVFLKDNSGSADYPYITKSSTNDGTWTTAGGYPLKLSTASYDDWTFELESLTSEKMYVIYIKPNGDAYGQLYDGSWQSQETITTIDVWWSYYSSTAVGDDVYFAFKNQDSPYYIHAVKRNGSGSGWGDVETVTTTDGVFPILSHNGT